MHTHLTPSRRPTLQTCHIYVLLSGLCSVKKVLHSDFTNMVDSAFIGPSSAINTEKHWRNYESIYKNVPIYNKVKKKAWQLPCRKKYKKKTYIKSKAVRMDCRLCQGPREMLRCVACSHSSSKCILSIPINRRKNREFSFMCGQQYTFIVLPFS